MEILQRQTNSYEKNSEAEGTAHTVASSKAGLSEKVEFPSLWFMMMRYMTRVIRSTTSVVPADHWFMKT